MMLEHQLIFRQNYRVEQSCKVVIESYSYIELNSGIETALLNPALAFMVFVFCTEFSNKSMYDFSDESGTLIILSSETAKHLRWYSLFFYLHFVYFFIFITGELIINDYLVRVECFCHLS